jgi:hypothetical protein
VLVDLSDRQLGFLAVLLNWQDLFLSVSLAFTGGWGEGFLWRKDVGPEVVDMLFLSNFVNGRRRILVQHSTWTSPGRCATATCLFIDSQSLDDDGSLLDLAMVEARISFWRASRRWL